MMRSHLRTLWLSAVALVAVFFFTMQSGRGLALAAGTAPGVVITNTATATYSDGNGVSYTTNSNTVTTTVQNAPSLTITAPAAQTVAPGQVVVDTYTLTNTGNAAGNFTIPTGTPATVGANGTFDGYVIAGTTCTATAPCTIAQANTALAGLAATASGGTLTVGVEYTVNAADVAGNTIPTTLTAQIVQPAVGTIPAATSANATATVTDTVATDARLDLQKSITPATGAAPAPIGFKIVANNGGGFAATDLQSVKALLGGAAPAGVLITDLIPQFGGVPLTLSGTPTFTVPAGTTGTVYYSTSATGAAGSWSTTYAAGDFFIALEISGGAGGVELASDPAGSTGAGNVTTTQASLSFDTVQPTGSGSANTGSISNLANSVIGGHPGASGLTPIIGPNIPAGTNDSATPTTPLTAAIDNTTPGNGATAPGGASNRVTGNAFSTASVLNGPADAAGATGSYPAAPNNGAATATNALDFTAVSFPCSATTVTGTTCTIPATASISIPGTYTNTGNAADTLTATVTIPAGFTATIYNATCPATIPAGSNIQTVCTISGAALGTGSATATATGTVTGSFGSVASGASGNYIVVYKPITGANPVANGVGIDATVTVSGTSGDSNATHQDLYPGGPLALNKSAAVVSGCPGTGQTAGGICPGGTITYTVAYANQAPAAAVTTNAGTEPAYAYQGITTGAVTITEDGTGSTAATATNNWATYTNGLTGIPAVNNTAGTTAFTFAYGTTGAGAYSTTTPAAGAVKFTATATTIAPGSAGTIVFSAVVK